LIVLAEILPVINNKVLASAVSGLSIENLQNKIGSSNSAIQLCLILPRNLVHRQPVLLSTKRTKKADNVVALFGLGTAPIIDEKLMDAAQF
jgi:pyrroline-5-carboxylate reductase